MQISEVLECYQRQPKVGDSPKPRIPLSPNVFPRRSVTPSGGAGAIVSNALSGSDSFTLPPASSTSDDESFIAISTTHVNNGSLAARSMHELLGSGRSEPNLTSPRPMSELVQQGIESWRADEEGMDDVTSNFFLVRLAEGMNLDPLEIRRQARALRREAALANQQASSSSPSNSVTMVPSPPSAPSNNSARQRMSISGSPPQSTSTGGGIPTPRGRSASLVASASNTLPQLVSPSNGERRRTRVSETIGAFRTLRSSSITGANASSPRRSSSITNASFSFLKSPTDGI